MRALSHPARLVVIDSLYAGEVLTATQCAALAGITPSAMSYHLRALEKYGIVRRVATGGDGRERPWMRAGDVLRIDLRDKRGSAAAIAAASVLIESSLAVDQERLVRAMQADAAAPDDPTWRHTTAYNRDLLVLTPDQARELSAAMSALVEPYLAEHHHGRRPRGSAVFSTAFLLAREPGDATS